MQTKATVISIDGEFATVEAERTSACEGCHKAEEGGCSVCSLMGSDRKIATRAYNPVRAKVGDRVLIESKSARMLWYGVLVFILPIVVALLAWGIASQFTENIVAPAISAFAGFALVLIGVSIYSKKVLTCRCDVEIVEILMSENKEQKTTLE